MYHTFNVDLKSIPFMVAELEKLHPGCEVIEVKVASRVEHLDPNIVSALNDPDIIANSEEIPPGYFS